jgi:phosphate starvation-inducible protein PhoH and related proteins
MALIMDRDPICTKKGFPKTLMDEALKDTQTTERMNFENNQLAQSLFGEHNQHIRLVEQKLGVKIATKGNTLQIRGETLDVRLAQKLLSELYELLKKGYPLYDNDIDFALRFLRENHEAGLQEVFLDAVYVTSQKRVITPKTQTQKAYIEAIRKFDIVFGIGPAGTGKTYLAMSMAVSALMKNEVIRIVLARPAVEAGEKLGFLPGDLYEKVNPYLRPLYDALHDMMNFEKANKLVQRGIIEVAPLAFMRGRTLNDSFVILDEAQNTTSEQMKMFLTRLGFSSKAVITGDITQIDLPEGKTSGLVEVRRLLEGIEDIAFVTFTKKDVIRHPLVQKIIKAYEESEERRRTLRERG